MKKQKNREESRNCKKECSFPFVFAGTIFKPPNKNESNKIREIDIKKRHM